MLLPPALLCWPDAEDLDDTEIEAGLGFRRAEVERLWAALRARGLARVGGTPGSGRSAVLRALGARARQAGWEVQGPVDARVWGGWERLGLEPGPQRLVLVEHLDTLPPPPPGWGPLAGTVGAGVYAEVVLGAVREPEARALLALALGCAPPPGLEVLAVRVCGGQLRALAGFAAGYAEGLSQGRGLETALRGAVKAGAPRRRASLLELPPGERAVLGAALELWEEVPASAVAARLGLAPNPCSAVLARLVDRGLLRITAREGRRQRYMVSDPLAPVEGALARADARLALARTLAEARLVQAARRVLPPPRPPLPAAPALPSPWPEPTEALAALVDRALAEALPGLWSPPEPPACSGREDPQASRLLREPPTPGWAHRALGLCKDEAHLSPALHLSLAQRALTLQPGEARAERAVARALQRLDHPDTLPALRRALDANPRKPGAWERLVDALIRAGQHDEALALAAAALRRLGGSARTWGLLGRVHLARGEAGGAVEALRRGAQEGGGGLALALALAAVGQAREAAALLEDAPEHTALRALLLARAGDAAASTALRRHPEDPRCAAAGAWLALAGRRPEQALALLEAHSTTPEARLPWAVALSASQIPPARVEQAWRALAQAGEAAGYAGLADHLERQPSRRADAEIAWRRALDAHRSPGAMARLAALLAPEDPEQALALGREALALHGPHPGLVAALARGLASRGAVAQALSLLDEAPEHPHTLAQSATLREEAQDPAGALRCWTRAVGLRSPPDERARLGLAACQLRLGRPDEALAALEGLEHPWAWALRAWVHGTRNEPVPARALVRRACEGAADPGLWALRLGLAARGLEDPQEVAEAARSRLRGDAARPLAGVWAVATEGPPHPALARWLEDLSDDEPGRACTRRLRAWSCAALGQADEALVLLRPDLEQEALCGEDLAELLPALDALAAALGPETLAELLGSARLAPALEGLRAALRAQAGASDPGPALLRALGAPLVAPRA